MERIRDLNHLKARIREYAEQVTREMLQPVWQEVVYGLQICKVTDSVHMGIYELYSGLFLVHFKISE
jgi:hypothetical protein